MAQLECILDKVKETNDLVDVGNINDAVLLSGEALAQSYELWQQKINSHQQSDEEVTVLSIAASCHCNALASANQLRDAYETSIGAILQITVDGNISATINQSLLSLYSTALYSLMGVLSSANPSEDETIKSHIEAVARYISSMLYFYYNVVGKETPSCPYLDGAYQGLRYAQGFVNIETDEITVNSTQISPSTPNDIIGDIIGRSNALGFFSPLSD